MQRPTSHRIVDERIASTPLEQKTRLAQTIAQSILDVPEQTNPMENTPFDAIDVALKKIWKGTIPYEDKVLLGIKAYAHAYAQSRLGLEQRGDKQTQAAHALIALTGSKEHARLMTGAIKSTVDARIAEGLMQAPPVKPKRPLPLPAISGIVYQDPALTPQVMLSSHIGRISLPQRQQLAENIMGALIPNQRNLENIFIKYLPNLSLQNHTIMLGNDPLINQMLHFQLQLAENAELNNNPEFQSMIQDVEAKLRERDGDKGYHITRSLEKFIQHRQEIFITLREYAHLYIATELRTSDDDLETTSAQLVKTKEKIDTIFGNNSAAVCATIENGAKTLALQGLKNDWYRPSSSDAWERAH